LLFAAKEQLDILKSATEVHFDATFKVVPGLYYQLLTVFAPCGDAAFPVMYALMTRKTRALYRAVFATMHNLVPEFVPENVMADFEEASQEVFGSVTVSGCWFHYCQAVYW